MRGSGSDLSCTHRDTRHRPSAKSALPLSAVRRHTVCIGATGAYWALHSRYPVIRTLSIRLARLSEDVFTDTSKYCGGSVPSMPLIVVRMASTTCVCRPWGLR